MLSSRRATDLAQLISLSGQYNTLQETLKNAQDDHELLRAKTAEARLKQDQISEVGAMQVVEPAFLPGASAGSAVLRLTLVAALAAFLLSLVLVLVLELIRPTPTRPMNPLYRSIAACPACRGTLVWAEVGCTCERCGLSYPVLDGVPFLRVDKHGTPLSAAAPPAAPNPSLRARLLNFTDPPDFTYKTPIGRDRIPHFVEHLGPNAVILNLGSGRTSYGLRVVNLDIGPFSNVDVVAMGERLPVADASLDAVITQGVLEHVPDLPATLAKIDRVLRSGGLVYRDPLHPRLSRLADRLPALYAHRHWRARPRLRGARRRRRLRSQLGDVVDQQRVAGDAVFLWQRRVVQSRPARLRLAAEPDQAGRCLAGKPPPGRPDCFRFLYCGAQVIALTYASRNFLPLISLISRIAAEIISSLRGSKKDSDQL